MDDPLAIVFGVGVTLALLLSSVNVQTDLPAASPVQPAIEQGGR
jgi:hypothetical protein